MRLGTALSPPSPTISETPPASCWHRLWLCYQDSHDDCEALPSLLCRSGSVLLKDAFWSSALCGGMEQTPSESQFNVAASAPSNGSVRSWASLPKIRPECVLTHGVISQSCGVAKDQKRHICESHSGESTPRLGWPRCPGSRSHSCPGAPLCIGTSGALSFSESTQHHEVLRHILAGDVKAFGCPQPLTCCVCPGGPWQGLGTARMGAGSSIHSWDAGAGRC